MKKLLLTIALAVAGSSGLITSAQAHDHHCGGWSGGCYYNGPYCGYYDNCWDNDGSCWYFYGHNDRGHDHDGRRR